MDKKNLILLFSHILTEEQREDVKKTLQCENVIYLPENLKECWGAVEIENRDKIEKMMEEFLLEVGRKGDYVLIQGEWGVTYNLVNFCKERELVPIYSSSKREVTEICKEDKIIKMSVFKHRGFVRY